MREREDLIQEGDRAPVIRATNVSLLFSPIHGIGGGGVPSETSTNVLSLNHEGAYSRARREREKWKEASLLCDHCGGRRATTAGHKFRSTNL